MSSNESAMPGLGLPSRGFDAMPRLRPEDPYVLRGAGGEPAPGPDRDSGSQDRSVLASAAALRFPNLKGIEGRERIELLVDHINDTAIARGELEELRLETHTALLELRDRWALLLHGRSFRTKAAADEARRDADPALASSIERATWLVARCTEQITRLGGSDYDAASRTYTMLGG